MVTQSKLCVDSNCLWVLMRNATWNLVCSDEWEILFHTSVSDTSAFLLPGTFFDFISCHSQSEHRAARTLHHQISFLMDELPVIFPFLLLHSAVTARSSFSLLLFYLSLMYEVCASCQSWFLVGLHGNCHVHLWKHSLRYSTVISTSRESVRSEYNEPPCKLKTILWLLSVWFYSQPYVKHSNGRGEKRRLPMDHGQLSEHFYSPVQLKSWSCLREMFLVELEMDG